MMTQRRPSLTGDHRVDSALIALARILADIARNPAAVATTAPQAEQVTQARLDTGDGAQGVMPPALYPHNNGRGAA